MPARMIKPLPLPPIAAFFAILILPFLFPLLTTADVYKYVDQNDVIHLTNVPPAGSHFKILIREGPPALEPENGPPAHYDALIARTAGKYGVDRALVKAVIKAESNFDSKAVSKRGAKGLMQLMPKTAEKLGVGDCFHPGDNIEGGIRHLAYLLDLYQGNIPLVLAAYNAGETAVARHGGIPPYLETRTYISSVLDHYGRYREEAEFAAAAANMPRLPKGGRSSSARVN
ncbi:MAG: Membrane-bound lytic murein transglycosylase C precursor [Syntrophaceae bacterium PtaU1.Bin231]|nr:MAG: Membrane-bound lytic murein transglycosylase C precursor [Syntrophaceae bacterium PtaU1.Bin231]